MNKNTHSKDFIIQPVSDIHNEYGRYSIPIVKDRNVLVIAGDYDYAKYGTEEIRRQAEHSYVILVPGNHDFHGCSIQEVIDFWDSQTIPNFHFLSNSNVVLDGVNFIGSTLFPCFNKGDPVSIQRCNLEIGDFYHKRIYKDSTREEFITANDFYELSVRDKAFVKNALEKLTSRKNVLISHYLPTYESVSDKYKQRESQHALNGAYVCDIENILQYSNLDLIIHGHTHDSKSYDFCGIPVICNPRGYKDKNMCNNDFKGDLIVRV